MTVEPVFPPRLADGVELLGEFKDSGYSKPRSLIKRADGQVIQLSRLLYLVARRMDGTHGPLAIADLVSDDLGRSLSAGQVCYLIVTKLAPLGIVAGERSTTPPRPASQLLAVRAKGTLLPARTANAAGAFFQPLFHWPVIAAVLVGLAVADYQVVSSHALGAAFGQLLNDPIVMLVLAALSVAAALFHECGHAAACRYGGARPGRIGFGIYLVWPSFFTNVTDSYRLSRGGRIRTDLGGVYFNAIFILALAGVYACTSAKVLLLAILFIHIQMLEQLVPFGRFDGYFVLSDLVGVPDLFAQIGPALRSVLPGRGRGTRIAGLDRRAQAIITGWMLCLIPLLAAAMGYLLLHLPAVNRDLWRSTSQSAHLTITEIARHRYAAAAVEAINAGLAGISIAGSFYITVRLGRRLAALGGRWSADHLRRRLIVILVGAAVAVSLTAYWKTHGQFTGW
jgi:putative peptide zinc metalloprotease protein